MRLVLKLSLLLLTILGTLTGSAYAATQTSEELLASSIARHDPEGEWQNGRFRMEVRESRPDGSSRDTTLVIDNSTGAFQMSSLRDGNLLAGELADGGCTWLLNGSPNFSDQDRERHRLTCDRLERMRNYYTYLWGLPMKLRDPGTHLGDKVIEKTFGSRSALELRVTYDEAVGG